MSPMEMYGEEVCGLYGDKSKSTVKSLARQTPLAPPRESCLEGPRLLRHYSDVSSYQSDVKRTLQLGLQGRMILRA